MLRLNIQPGGNSRTSLKKHNFPCVQDLSKPNSHVKVDFLAPPPRILFTIVYCLYFYLRMFGKVVGFNYWTKKTITKVGETGHWTLTQLPSVLERLKPLLAWPLVPWSEFLFRQIRWFYHNKGVNEGQAKFLSTIASILSGTSFITSLLYARRTCVNYLPTVIHILCL